MVERVTERTYNLRIPRSSLEFKVNSSSKYKAFNMLYNKHIKVMKTAGISRIELFYYNI